MRRVEYTSVYIAGPMESAGGNWNIPLFDYVAERLRAHNCDVFNPADNLRAKFGSVEAVQKMDPDLRRFARQTAMQEEIMWIFTDAKIMFMLPGWEKSPGARAEHAVAQAIGMEIRETGTIVLPTGDVDTNDINLGEDDEPISF